MSKIFVVSKEELSAFGGVVIELESTGFFVVEVSVQSSPVWFCWISSIGFVLMGLVIPGSILSLNDVGFFDWTNWNAL